MSSENSETLYQKAIKLDSKGEYQQALTVYKQIARTSSDPRHLIAYGVCLQRLGHWKQSIAALEKGLALKPHYCEGDARLFLAKAYIKSGKKSLAIRQWQHVTRMQPEYPSYDSVQDEARKMLSQHA